MMYEIEKSDEVIVVMTTANSGRPTEQDERRISLEGKVQYPNTGQAQKWETGDGAPTADMPSNGGT